DTYKYDGPRPHAPTSAQLGTLSESYGYDDKGNLKDRTGTMRPPLHVDYDTHSKPTRMYSVNAATDGTSFTYDAFDTRSRKTTPTSSTVYFDGFYNRTRTGSNVSENFL